MYALPTPNYTIYAHVLEVPNQCDWASQEAMYPSNSLKYLR